MTKTARYVFAAIALLLALAHAPARAQWTHFDNNGDVRAMYQAGDSLWVATNGGLLIVDLLTNDVRRKIRAGESLADNSVRAIGGREGEVYVATDHGLSVFRRRKVDLYTASDAVVYTDVRGISFGPDGEAYLATFGHGVGVMKNGKIRQQLTKVDSLLDNKVFAVAALDSGTYYATSMGLCAYKDSLWVSYQAGVGLPRGEVRDLIHVERVEFDDEPSRDLFFVLIADRGVYRFDGVVSRRIATGEAFGEDMVTAVAKGENDELWAAGRFGGIARYRADTWQVFGKDDPDIRRARWRSAHSGADGAIYFGSAEGLIVVIQDDRLRKIVLPSLLPDGHVGRLAQDAEGRKFIVNGSYLLSTRRPAEGFSLESQAVSVFSLEVSPRGAVWVSTPWGLLRRDGGGWSEVLLDIEPSLPLFVSIAFEPAGHLWAGSNEGEVYRFDGDLWVEYAQRGELTSSPIHRILVDARENVWVLSRTEGVFRYNGLRWETFPSSGFETERIAGLALDPLGLPVLLTAHRVWRYDYDAGWLAVDLPTTNEIGVYRSIYFDAAGRMYLGTASGVAVFAGRAFRWVGPEDGLRGRDVTALLVDQEENLWVGFQRDGISMISLQRLWSGN